MVSNLYCIKQEEIIMAEMKNFLVRCPKETWELLKDMAKIQGRSMSSILIEMVEKKRKKFQEKG